VPGKTLGYYVSQYDGEIASVDAEVGRVLAALDATPVAGKTVVVLTSDHGESLGEHDYYFDHGEDLFDPCLAIRSSWPCRAPRAGSGRPSSPRPSTSCRRSWTRSRCPIPPDLAGTSVLGAVAGRQRPGRTRLFAQNDRNLSATFDERFKLVDAPLDDGHAETALYDRQRDPGETRDVRTREPRPSASRGASWTCSWTVRTGNGRRRRSWRSGRRASSRPPRRRARSYALSATLATVREGQ
jgi:hypothetical protein